MFYVSGKYWWLGERVSFAEEYNSLQLGGIRLGLSIETCSHAGDVVFGVRRRDNKQYKQPGPAFDTSPFEVD